MKNSIRPEIQASRPLGLPLNRSAQDLTL